MPRLSEIDGNETTQLCLFLKFATEKWHLESLQSGKLRMNNLKRFIDMEKNEGKKGMGDLLEVSNVINLLNFKLIDPDTDEVIFEGKSSRGVMTLNHCTPKPVFCLAMVDSKMLEVIEEDDKCYKCKVVFLDIQKRRFIEDFGNHVMVLPVSGFLERVIKAFDKHEYGYVYQPVLYDDFNVNHSNRLKSFEEENTDVFFWKDKSIEYQNEFRIVILNKDIEEPLVTEIGDLSDISFITTSEKLFMNELILSVNK
ncbi:hypothetical protein [Paenibacillus abyssi]|uniref:Uncharacterized protein n=1 Tax=Paenibacillus abyssi TaxID=1340531 RepID=A0A917CWG9_9BACL|nr:hypothetical protein [Paenibacillus abyssi]GGG02146.1 hypothetical protein GCM10010916_19150 [Paenibacillus abyssi]